MWRRILMRNFLDDSIVEHNSKPPLRWIANWAGSRASAAVMRAAWLDEDGIDRGIRQTINSAIYRLLWPMYRKYGTFYKIDWPMDGQDWEDYDEDGVPYWEKTGTVDPDYYHWDYIDEETGDAFKVINFGGKE
jgi:hypothetical protein